MLPYRTPSSMGKFDAQEAFNDQASRTLTDVHITITITITMHPPCR